MADTVVDMAAATAAVMDTTMARDLPRLSPKLLPLPSPDMAAIVDMAAMDMEATAADIAADMAADTADTAAMVAMEVIMARDLLTPRLGMAAIADMDMAVTADSPAVTVDSPEVMAVTDTARDLLMPRHLPVMAVIAAMDMAAMEADIAAMDMAVMEADTAAVMEVMAATAIMVKLSLIKFEQEFSVLSLSAYTRIVKPNFSCDFNCKIQSEYQNKEYKDILLKISF